uniref:Uncharacterized protein n=1 Tax=Arundo donax TaxID=35708 RepID=A0A0A9FU80_ARUDO
MKAGDRCSAWKKGAA